MHLIYEIALALPIRHIFAYMLGAIVHFRAFNYSDIFMFLSADLTDVAFLIAVCACVIFSLTCLFVVSMKWFIA